VVETLVEDPGGNTNRIRFSKISTNVGLKDKAFRFEVPDGVDVVESPDG
jgi:outer membrane lipoprotein-sorting protein